MATDPVAAALASAKSTLAQSEKSFPTRPSVKATPAPTAAPAKAPTLGDELHEKAKMVGKARQALPQMHDGGPVHTDGDYSLRAGEHVLTAPQAKMVRKHALMAVGMSNLAKPAQPPTGGEPKAAPKSPAKKSTSGITVRPEKKQAAKKK